MDNVLKTLEYRFIGLICLAAAANALLPALTYSLNNFNLSEASLNGFGHSYVIWLCLLLAIRLSMTGQSSSVPISPVCWVLILPACVALLVPSATLSWLICIYLCLIWRFLLKPDIQQKLASLIILAIAIRNPLCQSLLHLFAQQILSFDAWISGIILWLIENPVTISGNTITQADGHSLLILTGCSAFSNLSLALLLWFSFSLYRHGALYQQDYLRALLLVCLILGLNATRLALMAVSPDWYHLLHDGHSQEVIEFLTIAIALLCIRKSQRHENTVHA